MLWYQLLESKIISNQQRLKTYLFTIKFMTNRNEKKLKYLKKFTFLQCFLVFLLLKTIFSYFIKINKFFNSFYKIY